LLLLAIALIFGQTVGYGFVSYDDGMYVYENAHVSRGLTTQGIGWAFTHEHGGNWHPLTSLSHMVDCQLFGLHAGWHHLINVLLHAATVILLLLVLWRMTDDLWPSALVAALFAVHPLRVESVAWIAERKDVLSGFCFMLTLAAYLGYVRNRFSLVRYLVLLAVFVLGLMAKPMLVTLPFVLLLLDYWPLGRMRAEADGANSRRLSHLLLEKIPLFVLAAVACALALWSQSEGSALNQQLPFSWRIGNAIVSYASYLGQLFCPTHLAVFYPHPGANLPAWKILVAVIILASVSTAALAYRRRYPYLLIGWLWYLGMLVPVIGLVQTGSQARADRYTYLSEIGLCMALAWGAVAILRARSYRGWPVAVTSALVLAILTVRAWQQTCCWCDSESLWRSAVAAVPRNGLAHCKLADALARQHRFAEAMTQYQEAVDVDPTIAEAHNNFGFALASRGQLDEAIRQYEAALAIDPYYAEAHNNLGLTLAARGRIDQARDHYQKALENHRDYADAHNNLGLTLAALGQIDQAIAHYQQAVEINPDFAQAHNNLGIAWARHGQFGKAVGCFQRALDIQPDFAEGHSNLGLVFASRGRIDQARDHYQKALLINPNFAEAHYNLALVLQAQGKLKEAIDHLQQAVKIRPAYVDAHNRLAWVRATWPEAPLRNAVEALEQAERANELCAGRQPAVLDTLAAAYAEAGRFPEAVATVRKALELAKQQPGNAALADGLQTRLALYQAGKPYRQTVSPPAQRKP
jgi:tetratricopeptide (TPR) repeat protein